MRIGVLVPSTNTSVESDFQKASPDDVSIHGQRLWIPDGEMTPAFLDRMNEDLDSGIRTLASARVDVMVYACTSGSFYKGADWDDAVLEKIRTTTGRPAVATSPAAVDALRHVRAKRLSVTTPYPDWTNEKLKIYLEGMGFEVLNVEGDARAWEGGHSFINDQDPSEIVDFVMRNLKPGADTIFCSCTAWRAMEAAAIIERESGKTVITSNQATVWATLRLLGRNEPIAGFGRLLA